jgi:hypothetical protein
MDNEELARKAYHNAYEACGSHDEAAFIKQRRALTNLLDASSPELVLRFARESQYPTLNFQMPVVVFGNGNREADHMNNYAVAKGTCER